MPHTEKDMIQAAIDDAKRAIKQHQSLKAETFKKEQERQAHHEQEKQKLNTLQRTSWEQYFMNIAKQVSTRATCPRLSVGAVVVKDRQILATGYNGSVEKASHCTDVGCYIVGGSCVRSVHAEQNAILMASKHGISLKGADIYVTHEPCYNCTKYLVQAGIDTVYYQNPYFNEETQELKESIIEEVGLKMIEIKE